ncbi:MAG: hypothetical protein N2C14_30080 [Planctomycetales bacterium]
MFAPDGKTLAAMIVGVSKDISGIAFGWADGNTLFTTDAGRYELHQVKLPWGCKMKLDNDADNNQSLLSGRVDWTLVNRVDFGMRFLLVVVLLLGAPRISPADDLKPGLVQNQFVTKEHIIAPTGVVVSPHDIGRRTAHRLLLELVVEDL